MRLIDADALSKVLDNIDERYGIDSCGEGIHLCMIAVAKAPTVDRPHGEWKQISEPDIEGKVIFECSNCGYYHKHHERLVVNFCECCGAEMGNVQEEFARISKELFVGLDMKKEGDEKCKNSK